MLVIAPRLAPRWRLRAHPACSRHAAADVSRHVDLVTTDVIVRDSRDQFISDLKMDEFEVFEDGVPQNLVSLVLTHGGRVFNVQSPPPVPHRRASSFRPPGPRMTRPDACS